MSWGRLSWSTQTPSTLTFCPSMSCREILTQKRAPCIALNCSTLRGQCSQTLASSGLLNAPLLILSADICSWNPITLTCGVFWRPSKSWNMRSIQKTRSGKLTFISVEKTWVIIKSNDLLIPGPTVSRGSKNRDVVERCKPAGIVEWILDGTVCTEFLL